MPAIYEGPFEEYEAPFEGREPSDWLKVKHVTDENKGGGPNGHFEIEIFGDHFSAGKWAVTGVTNEINEISTIQAEAVLCGFEDALVEIAERALRKSREMRMERLGIDL